jgi:2,3-bisphosphoglycerate-independent phosphoglycerate mutase
MGDKQVRAEQLNVERANSKKPVVLIIMDGYGLRADSYGNAVAQARTPNLDRLRDRYPHTQIEASGLAVGLPCGQMGNSEVGHLNLGAGRIVYQDLTRVTQAIGDGSFAKNEVLLGAIEHALSADKQLHLFGLLSDGGVHSHNSHLYALLELARAAGFNKVYVHAFLDGRDVAPDSGLGYLRELQAKFAEIGVGQLATVMGRYYAMDRDNRWERVEKAYRALVYGQGRHTFDPLAAIDSDYNFEKYDEFIEPLVVMSAGGQPVACVEDGDSIIFFNFRPDRAIQLTKAFVEEDFTGFDRSHREEDEKACNDHYPGNIHYVALTQYSVDLPVEVAYEPIDLEETLGQVLEGRGLRQLRIAETEKYPHVTYFFNGGRELPYEGEDRVLIPSPKVATYDLQPEMSAYEVTEALKAELAKTTYDVVILNYANCDMVGHTGFMGPAIQSVEAVDANVGAIVDYIEELGGVALITADHGNAEAMLDPEGNPITAHSTNPVPLIVTDPAIKLKAGGKLADIAPTILEMMGIEIPSAMTGVSLIDNR